MNEKPHQDTPEGDRGIKIGRSVSPQLVELFRMGHSLVMQDVLIINQHHSKQSVPCWDNATLSDAYSGLEPVIK